MVEKRKSHNQEGSTSAVEKVELPECFVIMPISDQAGYDSGHFLKVYEDIFKPACLAAGFAATRADDVKQSNLIHLDILKRVVQSPMAICDLSSRNPNVLFELGLRQAFDKPTILVKDEETPDIFDIAPIRYTNYRRALRYRDVLSDQEAIAEAIRTTRDTAGQAHNVNSLIRLLELAEPAKIAEGGATDPSEYLQILLAEVSQLRREVRMASKTEGAGIVSDNSVANASTKVLGRASRLDIVVKNIIQKIEAGTSTDDIKDEIAVALQQAEDAADYYRRSRNSAEMAPRLLSVMENIKILRKLNISI